MQENDVDVTCNPPALTEGLEKYKLSPAGEALLAVIVDPVARTMSVRDICRTAGISHDSYYRLFKQETFVAAYLDACKTACITAAMPTMQSVAGKAIAGDMQAAQMILSMAGLHQPTARVEHTHTHEAGKSLLDMYKARKAVE